MQDPNKPIWINSENKEITTINLEEALKNKKNHIEDTLPGFILF